MSKILPIVAVLLFSPILVLAANTVYLLGSSSNPDDTTFGVPHTFGSFRTDGMGNAGKVEFYGGNKDAASDAAVEGTNLVGRFYVQTIGWVSFYPNSRIIPPASGRPTDRWGVVGTLSSNAGTISLTGLQYDPTDMRLVGTLYNRGIGKIPFGSGLYLRDDGVGAGFVGRVKVLGNSAGNTIYKLEDIYDVDRYDISGLNTYINSIRENIAHLMRNVQDSMTNITNTTNKVFLGRMVYQFPSSLPESQRTLRYSDIASTFATEGVQSLIVIGGDMIVDRDILNTNTRPKAIIMIKDSKGSGGQIYVNSNVKHIESSLISEGSILSGTGKSLLYNDTAEKITNLPTNQLHIYGSVVSRNTIGGANLSSPNCPYGSTICSFAEAVTYDLNYFRGVDKKELRMNSGKRTPVTRAYKTNQYDEYAVVIEHDPRVLTDTPPGMGR